MKKELLKKAGITLSIALALISVGCSSKIGSTDKAEEKTVPTIAEEEQTICESSG